MLEVIGVAALVVIALALLPQALQVFRVVWHRAVWVFWVLVGKLARLFVLALSFSPVFGLFMWKTEPRGSASRYWWGWYGFGSLVLLSSLGFWFMWREKRAQFPNETRRQTFSRIWNEPEEQSVPAAAQTIVQEEPLFERSWRRLPGWAGWAISGALAVVGVAVMASPMPVDTRMLGIMPLLFSFAAPWLKARDALRARRARKLTRQ